MERRANERVLADVDWESFRPVDEATLVFVIREDEILLIRKKRGLGAGKINGPGGRLEPGESAAECAHREVAEELCVSAVGLRECGVNSFIFVDGYSIHVTVYTAEDCEGMAQETDEAIPLWTPLASIPYEEMWEDDILWLPHVIEGRRFRGRFIFEGDKMLDSEVVLE